jgi:plasmid stability protein
MPGAEYRMTDVRIRNVDDWVVELHRRQAKLAGRSLEGEIRQLLTDAALAKKKEIANQRRAQLEAFRQKYGTFSDSAAIIREDRDSRG